MMTQPTAAAAHQQQQQDNTPTRRTTNNNNNFCGSIAISLGVLMPLGLLLFLHSMALFSTNNLWYVSGDWVLSAPTSPNPQVQTYYKLQLNYHGVRMATSMSAKPLSPSDSDPIFPLVDALSPYVHGKITASLITTIFIYIASFLLVVTGSVLFVRHCRVAGTEAQYTKFAPIGITICGLLMMSLFPLMILDMALLHKPDLGNIPSVPHHMWGSSKMFPNPTARDADRCDSGFCPSLVSAGAGMWCKGLGFLLSIPLGGAGCLAVFWGVSVLIGTIRYAMPTPTVYDPYRGITAAQQPPHQQQQQLPHQANYEPVVIVATEVNDDAAPERVPLNTGTTTDDQVVIAIAAHHQ